MKTKKVIFSIVFSLLILVVAQLLAQLVASVLVLIKVPEAICNVVAGVLYILFAYYFIRLLCAKYIKDEMSNFNIPKFKIDIKWLMIAIVLPILVSAFYLLFVNGTLEKNELALDSKLSLLSAGIFFTGFGAGIVEEMVFRGVMMSAIEKKSNKKVAIIIPSLLFGIVHIIGMDFELLSCTMVVIAGTMVGIMFSLIASKTKSIWNSAVVHAFWNIVILGGFIWIGTEFDEYSLCSYVLNSNSFIVTGGEFGIESSLIAVIGYCLVSILVFIPRKKVSEE